jgi:hypothetical protein
MKQKKQVAVLAVLVAILAVVGYFYFDGDKPVVTADAGASSQDYPLIPVDNLSIHWDGVGKARKTEYKSGGRNIFSREIPRPPEPPHHEPKPGDKNYVPPQPIRPDPPKVSPLPAKFFGYGTVPNGTIRLAFFVDGEDVYIVKEGELLMSRFRINKIGNTDLEYEELATGLHGRAILEEQAAPSAP